VTVLALILILTLLLQDGVDTISATAVELIVILTTVSVIIDAMIFLGPPASEPTAAQLRRHASGRRQASGRRHASGRRRAAGRKGAADKLAHDRDTANARTDPAEIQHRVPLPRSREQHDDPGTISASRPPRGRCR
jgi:hypothetical protein